MLHKLLLAYGWNEMAEITDDQAVLLERALQTNKKVMDNCACRFMEADVGF